MIRKNRSGQVLLAGVLVIALLLLSVELYVYDLGKVVVEANENSFSDFILAVKLGSRHVVIGSLANVSQGGENPTLVTNLDRWSSFVWKRYSHRKSLLNFTTSDTSPYSSGVWTNWSRTDGIGVSGAFANFSLDFSGIQTDVQLEFDVNITTTLNVEAVYTKLEDTLKETNVTCRVLNEGEPALARNFTLFYEDNGNLTVQNWIRVVSLNNTDYGNGTYFMSFTADTQNRNDPLLVSVHMRDLRQIFVQTNITCTEV